MVLGGLGAPVALQQSYMAASHLPMAHAGRVMRAGLIALWLGLQCGPHGSSGCLGLSAPPGLCFLQPGEAVAPRGGVGGDSMATQPSYSRAATRRLSLAVWQPPPHGATALPARLRLQAFDPGTISRVATL